MIKAVIFDQDGLMFDTERIAGIAWHQAEKEWGIHLEESFLKTIRGMNHQDARIRFEEVFGDSVDFMAFRGKKQEIFEALLERDGIPVKPGLYELLEYLEAQKIPAALASASRMEYTERNLEKTGIRRYFCHLVTGDMVSHAKPNPEIFWKAAELLGEKPEDCLVLEDSLNGVEAGLRGGFVTVMVPDLTQPEEELKKRVYRVCSSLLEVKEMLEAERAG